jgi:hypothetical protein
MPGGAKLAACFEPSGRRDIISPSLRVKNIRTLANMDTDPFKPDVESENDGLGIKWVPPPLVECVGVVG